MDDEGLSIRLLRLRRDAYFEDSGIGDDVVTIISLVHGGPDGVNWDQRTKAMLERTEQRLTKKGIRVLHDQR